MRLRWGRERRLTCPQCSTPAPGDARWCGACGASLRDEVADDPDDDGEHAGRGGRLGRLTAAGTVLLVLGGLLVVQAAAEPPVVPAGFMGRGDGARTGIVSTVPVPAPSGVAWRTPVDLPPLLARGAQVLGTTVGSGGRELVVVHEPAESGQRITTHDAATGELVATTMLPLGTEGLTMADGLLAGNAAGSVTLHDLVTGEQLWRVDEALRSGIEVVPEGVVGVTGSRLSPAITLLSTADGNPVWRRPLDERSVVTDLVAVPDGLVVAVDGEQPALLGLDPASGSERWRADAALLPGLAAPQQPRVEAAGDRVLVAAPDEVVLVDALTGAMTTLLPPDGTTPREVLAGVVANGDTVVFSDGSRVVEARDLSGPEPRELWSVTAPVTPFLALAVRGGVVAVQGSNGTALLDLADGSERSRMGAVGTADGPVLTGDGGLVRLSDDAAVEVVDDGGARWRAPTVATHVPDLATDAGAVAVTTPDGVEVLDVADGTRRFAHEAFDSDLVTAGSLQPPVLFGGKVAVAPSDRQPPARGGLVTLFADTGIIDWARDNDRLAPRGVPVVDRDLVVLPVGSMLLGYEQASGRRALVVRTGIARHDLAAAGDWLVATDPPWDVGDLWVGRRDTREMSFRAPIRTCAPPVVHEDLAIVVDDNGDVLARELATGDQPWGERTGGSACRPLSLAEDVLVALVDDRELLAVRLDDGETAWRLELPDVAAGAPVIAGDQVLVPTLAGEILAYAVDGTTAPEAPVWRADVGGVPAGSVAVDGTTVLVLTRAGELVALR